jgi:membrane protein insertase Oxa1/YidC/SpoIIIJ
MSSWLPEVVQNFLIWGGTGIALKALHFNGIVPYWAYFALMSGIMRMALVPTFTRFAKVSPELQFIITLFQNDLKKMRAKGKGLYEQQFLFMQNLQTVRSIFKLHNINLLTVFLSPLLQSPFFYYIAVDLRKIVNRADPALAQELTEAGFWWVPDLMKLDPWYGVTNMEVAIGRQALIGPTAAKSDFAGLRKDLFQTLAVFMPCFASHSPTGLQIYLVSSFTFTLFQGAALHTDTMRNLIRLPSMGVPHTEPKYTKEFMEFKKLEQKAKEIHGDGPLLGRNVLAVGFKTSFNHDTGLLSWTAHAVPRLVQEAQPMTDKHRGKCFQTLASPAYPRGPKLHILKRTTAKGCHANTQ